MLEVDDIFERRLDLLGLARTTPAPQIVPVLAGAVCRRSGDPYADVGGRDDVADVRKVGRGLVGCVDGSQVGG